MINKRGQGLSTNAMVLIILGVLVLVLLIFGFTAGWNKLAPWLSGDNIQDVVDSCDIACSTNSVYNYCSSTKTLTDEKNNEITTNCNFFSKFPKLDAYGIAECPSIDCSSLPTCADILDESNIKVDSPNVDSTINPLPDKTDILELGLQAAACEVTHYNIGDFAGDKSSSNPYCCMVKVKWDGQFN